MLPLFTLLFAAEDACTEIHRGNLASCLASSNSDLRESAFVVVAAEARLQASKRILPNNPVVSFSAARRDSASQSATNLYGALSQEIEISGQRSQRIAAAAHQLDAERLQLSAHRRDVLAAGWRAYFQALAASERSKLASGLEQLATDVAKVARAHAEKGVLAALDAQLALATAVQYQQQRFDADRARIASVAELTVLLGRDPGMQAVSPSGVLLPLPEPESEQERPEIAAAEQERLAQEAHASMLRRERVPNPSLSFMVQSDGFNERVLGGGLALAIPLPGLGRTGSGEIAEAEALAAKAAARGQKQRRAAQLDLLQARAAYGAQKQSAARYTEASVKDAEMTLSQLTAAVEAGRMGVRDAVTSRQILTEFLGARLDTQLALALASVELWRVCGASLEAVQP